MKKNIILIALLAVFTVHADHKKVKPFTPDPPTPPPSGSIVLSYDGVRTFSWTTDISLYRGAWAIEDSTDGGSTWSVEATVAPSVFSFSLSTQGELYRVIGVNIGQQPITVPSNVIDSGE